jgi:aromatic ring-cleaving dioxygenase
MKRYHAHVYFKSSQVRDAKVFLYWLKNFSAAPLFHVQGFHENPIGPHPLPMFELQFAEDQKAELTQLLEQNRKDFSILIHEDTGDDVTDHSENVQWLGPRLQIDFDFFDLIKLFPECRIHPLV